MKSVISMKIELYILNRRSIDLIEYGKSFVKIEILLRMYPGMMKVVILEVLHQTNDEIVFVIKLLMV